MWGISYPGFYVSAGMIDAHPALKAVSPQAPVTDYYLGDDSFHNGAFMLAANFGFYTFFKPRPGEPRPPQPQSLRFDYGTPSGYEFFLADGAALDAAPSGTASSTTCTTASTSSTRPTTTSGARGRSGGTSATCRRRCSPSAAGSTPRT